MIDGIRLSDNEQVTALMSSIPLESVERIEIVRGGSSVLYGEGATGGTIQIITKRGTKGGTHGSIVAEVGSFDRKELRASLTKGWDQFSMNVNLGALHTDNYRNNSALKQENFSGGLQWASQGARFGFRVDSSRQDARFPGSLSYAEYLNDPRQTKTPNDYGSFDMDRYTIFGEKKFGNMELAADLSHRTKRVEFFQFGGLSSYDTKMTQFSPRLRYVGKSGNVTNEIVTGFDFSESNRVRNSSFSLDDATQRSAAIYFRDELKISDARIAFGARHEKFKKKTVDPVPFTSNYDVSNSLNAWTLEGSYALQPQLLVYAKTGRSYRIPNVDDNFFLAKPLVPQTSNDAELGASIGSANRQLLTVKVFQHNLKNEIMFDANTFSNANVEVLRLKQAPT
jgi:iron complex outermembrane receptor protein